MQNRPNESARSHKAGTCVAIVLITLIALLVTALVLYALHVGVGAPAQSRGEIRQSVPQTTVPTEPPSQLQQSQTTAPTEPEPSETEPSEPDEYAQAREKAEALLAEMTLEEKIYQMFVVTPQTLTGYTGVSVAGDATREALEEYPVGGIVYFSDNIYSEEQFTDMVRNSQTYSSIPLLICIDEEGGRVSRLSGIGVTDELEPMAEYGAAGDTEQVRSIGRTLGEQLASVGVNVDFAPVADVVTNPNNTEIGDRSFSDDPAVASQMVAAMVRGLHQGGAISCLKHFPGHGSTETDSHLGRAVSERTLDELRQTELLPFAAGIEAGADMVMISHMSVPEIIGDETPCDLSPIIVTGLLREELRFDGVVITDSHEMAAILDYYTTGEAAVLAVQAGCDIILMPNRMSEAAAALLEAVENGEISEERIDESVLRILMLKYRWGIIE